MSVYILFKSYGKFIFVLAINLLSQVQTVSSSPTSVTVVPLCSVFKVFIVLYEFGSHLEGDLSVTSVLKLFDIFITISSTQCSSEVSSEVHKLFCGIAFPSSSLLQSLWKFLVPWGSSFGLHGQKAGALVTPLSCALSQIAHLQNKAEIGQREKKINRGVAHLPGTTAPLMALKVHLFPEFWLLWVSIITPTAASEVLFGGWSAGKWRKKGKYKKGVPAVYLNIRYSFSCFLSQTKRSLLELCLAAPCVHFPVSGCTASRSRPLEGYAGKKIVISSLVWWYFGFWSSYTSCLLLLTFQSPLSLDPYIISRFYSCIQWQRRSEVCLLHFTQD